MSDARVRILAAVACIFCLTFVDISGFLPKTLLLVIAATMICGIGIALLLKVSPLKAAWRSCIVLPFAGGVAAFAPLAHTQSLSGASIALAYRQHGLLIVDILFKAYVASYVVALVMASMRIETFITALVRLKVPRVFITLFTFLYRFTDLFREQIAIMRNAARSRAPYLHGWRLLAFYGRMSGNLFIRAYERGEEVYGAMVSRGYDGTLPRTPERG
jgi:cobalt/nickel transport system permease protein